MDLNDKFKGFDGKEIEQSDTLKTAILNILGTVKGKTGEDTIKQYEAGLKVMSVTSISELTTTDKAFIISKINQGIAESTAYMPVVSAQMLKALE